jgi:cysteinyl-tRNA synthetase
MSKSLGNFVTVHEMLEQGVPGEAMRLALLSTHYRDPLDWTDERLQQAKQTLDRWYRALNEMPFETSNSDRIVLPDVENALADDLNTPLAIAHLHDVSREIYRASDPEQRGRLQSMMIASAQIMGLLQDEPINWLRGGPGRFVAHIEERIEARTMARKDRRFADADRIRSELAEDGIILEDKPDGTTIWRTR